MGKWKAWVWTTWRLDILKKEYPQCARGDGSVGRLAERLGVSYPALIAQASRQGVRIERSRNRKSQIRIAKRKAARAGNLQCQCCGQRENLVGHHRFPVYITSEPVDDIIILCRSCHSWAFRVCEALYFMLVHNVQLPGHLLNLAKVLFPEHFEK